MPIKISITISRKKGEPNYGSLGAAVGLEIEETSSLVEQPQQLQAQLARLFALAKEAVDRQLEGSLPRRRSRTEGDATRNAATRSATPAQIRAIHAIGSGQQLDLAAELQNRFGVERPAELTIAQASQLIDTIRQPTDGITHQG